MKADILIDGGIIMTVDREARIIKDGAIAINGNKIAAVGDGEQIKKKYPQAKKTIDGSNKLIMPGMINTHTHVQGFSLVKGTRPGNTTGSTAYNQDAINLFASPYWNDERFYKSGLLTAAELIKSGNTTVVDCSTLLTSEKVNAESAVKFYEDCGLRCVLGIRSMDIFDEPGVRQLEDRAKASGSTRDNIKRVEKMIMKYHKAAGGRVNIWGYLVLVSNSSDELLEGLKALADSTGTGVTTHANFEKAWTEATIRGWGMTDIERLYRLGFLGRNCLLAHTVHMKGDEVLMIKETGTSLSHCPCTCLAGCQEAYLFGNFPEWWQMDINISLGTDAQSVSNHMDLFRAMTTAYLVHREAKHEPNLWAPQDMVKLATVNGSKATLLEDEIGSIEVGKKADIILIDMMRPEWVPWHKYNLYENLVLSATGDSVDTSIIDGKVVMENREIKIFNEEEILEWAQQDVWEFLKTHGGVGTGPYPYNMPPLW